MNFFIRPEILFLIPLFIGVLLLLHFHSRKKVRQRIRLLVADKLKTSLIPSLSPQNTLIKLCLSLSAVCLILFSIAGPNWGFEQKKIETRGNDLIIAVDISRSMLVRDQYPNRLEKVKQVLQNRLNEASGNRLGLISFSRKSFTSCPLTLDHLAFEKTLSNLQVSLISPQGTDLAEPMKEASLIFPEDGSSKSLILISDGEDLEGRGLKQARLLAKQGIKVYTIGVGTQEGGKIPDPINFPLNQTPSDFHKDQSGNDVISKLGEGTLQEIADATNAQYVSLGATGEGLSHLFSVIKNHGKRKELELFSSRMPVERYQSFTLLAFILLVIEQLIRHSRRILNSIARKSFLFSAFLFVGFFKPKNIQLAEDAMKNGNPIIAGELYLKESEKSLQEGEKVDPKIMLNAGLCFTEGEDFIRAGEALEDALQLSIDSPNLQSKVLNALGNLQYEVTNQLLDQQNVNAARKTWEEALGHYNNASSIDGNLKAQTNLDSLNRQIQERIEAMVCKMVGLVWRDSNGNGRKDPSEPNLQAHIFWDKNDDGERNESIEPSIKTNENGEFAFEWISASYPTSLKLGSILFDQNRSDADEVLIPLYPPPPPPFSASQARNYHVDLAASGTQFLPMPWRAAPVIKGKVWNDSNQNGLIDDNESGLGSVSLFLDDNGNFKLDDNETSFKPSEDGKFLQVVPPGQYSLCIQPDSPEAKVTWPEDEHKGYLTWVNFEHSSDTLLFGVFDHQSGESSSSDQSDSENGQDEESAQNSKPESSENPSSERSDSESEEVSGLYERLLQEIESKSEPLPQDVEFPENTASGRDY